MDLTLTHDYVYLVPADEGKVGGLYIPDTAIDVYSYRRWRVEACGPDATNVFVGAIVEAGAVAGFAWRDGRVVQDSRKDILGVYTSDDITARLDAYSGEGEMPEDWAA